MPEYILQRNFDPETLEATQMVDGNLFTAIVGSSGGINRMLPFSTDFDSSYNHPLAVQNLYGGTFFTGLTYDDAGGLRYLYSPENINYETLLADARGFVGGRGLLVNGAWRPGVNKIKFVEQPKDLRTGEFQNYIYLYNDYFYLENPNGQSGAQPHRLRQQLRRVVSKPDILFCVGDLSNPYQSLEVDSTGTTNWINNAALNGNPTGAGPGVIRPPVIIIFGKTAVQTNYLSWPPILLWGSFDGTTNPPIAYPISHP